MKRTNHVLASAVLTVAMVGCLEDEKAPTFESRTLQQMLTFGANQYIINKYETSGRDTSYVFAMLETVGREGEEGHPIYVEELRARGFVLNESPTKSTQAMGRRMIRR